MTSSTPSSPYFNGIVYNPSFFSSSTGTYLNYPIAQGTETIGSLKTSSIESATPTTAMTLLSNQTANLTMATAVTGTIRLGAYTTTSTHIGNIDHQNNNINNASAPLVGSLGLGTSQTDGILNIGTGARTTTGAINIGTGSILVNPINIGSSTSALTLNGAVNTANTLTTNSLTVNAGYNLIANGSIACASYLSSSASTACTLASNVSSALITLGQAQTTGNIEIGNNVAFAGIVTIAGSLASGTNTINLGNAKTTININGTTNIGTTTLPLTMNASTSTLYTSGTISCRSGGMATFTSWNSADVNIGTESFSDLYIGYYGTSTNSKTTRIRTENVIIGGGSSGTTTINNTLSAGVGTLSGATAYETKAATYTIPSTINRDYYLVVTLAAVTITLPAVKLNQILHIRNASGGSITLTAPSGSIFPTVSGGGSFNSWTAFAVNTAQNLYCDGTNWYGF